MKSLTKKIFRFAIPSILSMWIFTLYSMIDGIFIGRYVGSFALGAVNLAMPMFNLSFGLGIMVAVGASTLISIFLAEGKHHKANEYFNRASLLAFSLGLLLSCLSYFCLDALVLALGAKGSLAPLVKDYIQVLLFFFPCYLCGYGWEIYIKVDGNASYPMFCVLLGACINLILDYLFLAKLHGGVRGAALATGIAQLSTTVCLFFYLYRKAKAFSFQKTKLSWKKSYAILTTGLPEFCTELSSGILILIFNYFSFLYLGKMGLISFSVISYLSSLIIMTMIGFAQGVQPILSYHYGKQEKKDLTHIFQISLRTITGLGLLFVLLASLFSERWVAYFLQDVLEQEKTAFAFRAYALSYLFLGWNILFSSFFTAMKKTKYSLSITFCRGLLFPILTLVFAASTLGREKIWFAALLSEGATNLLSYSLYQKTKVLWKEKKMD